MARKSLVLLAAVLIAITGASAERASPYVVTLSKPFDVLADSNYELNAEFDEASDIMDDGTGRRLQSKTETTYCNTWCQLKNSLGLTIVGFLLICLSPCLMWKNEGRHVKELRRISFCKNNAVVVPNADMPSDENIGQLVHFVGNVSVDEDAIEFHPGALNITAPLPKALVIKRTCTIYQKFEQAQSQVKNDKIGAGQTTTTTYTVKEDWTMQPQAERLEHLPGETNSRGIWDELVSYSGTPESAAPATTMLNVPPNMPPQLAALLQTVDLTKAPHALSISGAAHVGEFSLTKNAIMTEQAAFQAEWLPLPAELIPYEVEPLPELRKDRYGNLTTVEEGDEPVNGDILIKYEYCPDGFDASFIVQQVLAESDPEAGTPQHKFSFEKGRVLDKKLCFSDDLGVVWMVKRGRHDLHDMIKMATEEEDMITKMLRVICWAILVAGWMMLFSVITTILSTLPLLGALGSAAFFVVALIVGTTCCCAVTAIAYIRYRPIVAFGILAVAGAIAGLCISQLRSADQPPPDSLFIEFSSFIHTDNVNIAVVSTY